MTLAGMRGNHFVNILNKIDLLEEAIKRLINLEEPIKKDFDEFKIIMKRIPGIGLSTYSKLLYFFEVKFDGIPCLILDQRLIDVFNSQFYEGYNSLGKITDNNRENVYLSYLKCTNEISKELNTRGDNIEQFLFIFGNNLKM
jgi:hypothetical protein